MCFMDKKYEKLKTKSIWKENNIINNNIIINNERIIQYALYTQNVNNNNKKIHIPDVCKSKLGVIEQILEYPCKDEEQKRVLIKLRWNDYVETEKVKTILESNDSVKMVYNMNSPFYWRINKFIPRNKKDIQE